MRFDEIYDQTKYAFEHDEVLALLRGTDGYSYQAPMYPAYVPTCTEFIQTHGIYPLYNNSTDKAEIENKLYSAINELLNSTPLDIWIAFDYILCQKYDEEENAAPFIINDTCWEKLKAALSANRYELSVCKEYVGKYEQFGLWSDVVIRSVNCFEDYGIVLIDEVVS